MPDYDIDYAFGGVERPESLKPYSHTHAYCGLQMLPFTANPNRTFNILNWLTEAPGHSNIASFDFDGQLRLELRYGPKIVETNLLDFDWLIRNIHTNTYYVVTDDCVRDNFTIL